jgi:hypothetical protein
LFNENIKNINSPYQDCEGSYSESKIEFYKIHLYQNLTSTVKLSNEDSIKNIYIYDITTISRISFIDFKQLSNNENKNIKHFIINFVSRQFTTFRILNIPSSIKITFLVSFIKKKYV